jgi:hypothetical protein
MWCACLILLFFSRPSWLPNLEVPADTGIVDLSNVVLSNGRGGMIKHQYKCFVCGQNGGLKMKCNREDCCTTSDGKERTVMHVTCARQAGLEVRWDEAGELFFYGRLVCRSRTELCFYG